MTLEANRSDRSIRHSTALTAAVTAAGTSTHRARSLRRKLASTTPRTTTASAAWLQVATASVLAILTILTVLTGVRVTTAGHRVRWRVHWAVRSACRSASRSASRSIGKPVRSTVYGSAAGSRERELRPRLLRSNLIAKRDKESRDMLAMPVDFRERRTRAITREARWRYLQFHRIRLLLGAANVGVCRKVFHLDVGNGLTADVVVTTQKSSCSEQPAKGSVIELAQRIRERSRQSMLLSRPPWDAPFLGIGRRERARGLRGRKDLTVTRALPVTIGLSQ